MKKNFWKNSDLIFACSFFSALSIVFIVIFSILFSYNNQTWPGFLFGLPLIAIFVFILLSKEVLSRISLSEEGIKVIRLKKELNYLLWTDIVEIERTTLHGTQVGLCFITHNNKIEIAITKKIYNSIISICPYQHIKNRINEFDCFRLLAKSKHK